MISRPLRATRRSRPPLLLAVTLLVLAAPRAHAAWSMHGGNPQHTALAPVPTQSLQQIHWQMPVDLNPQYSGDVLFIHYGSPLVTEGNTVIVPVKVGVADTFRVEARRGSDGLPLWQLATDYQLPPHSWVPSVGLTLAHAGRVYVPGAGGTLLWTGALDMPGPHTATRVAFFGNAAYASNPAAFQRQPQDLHAAHRRREGHGVFRVRRGGRQPARDPERHRRGGRTGAGGSCPWRPRASGLATQIATNCAPALSRDEQTLYIAARPAARRRPPAGARHVRPQHATGAVARGPGHGDGASVSANGTASPMIAPDDKVYYGVLENPFGSNAVRGWMLQFDAD
jgi:hypothetical protein